MMKAKENHREAKIVAKGAGVNFLTLIAKFGRPIFFFTAAYFYGAHDYGVYFLAWTYIEFLSLIAPLGMDKAVLRYVAYHNSLDEKKHELACFRTALIIGFLVSLSLSIALLALSATLASYLNNPDLTTPLRWLSFIIFFKALSQLLFQVPIAHKVMKYGLYFRGLLEPIMMILLSIIFYWMGLGLRGLCMAHLLASAVVFIASIFPVFEHFPLRLWFDHSDGFHQEIFQFSRIMFLSDIVSNLSARLDIMILGYFASSSVIGVYGIMSQVANVIQTVRFAFDPIANPLFTELHAINDTQRLGATYKMITRWVMILTFPLVAFMLLYGGELVVLVNPQNQMGVDWLYILIAGTSALAFFGLSGYLLAMTGHPESLLKSQMINFLISGAITFLLIRSFGPVGAALGAALSLILTQLLTSWWGYSHLKVHVFSFNLWKPAFSFVGTLLFLFYLRPFSFSSPVWNLVIHGLLILGIYSFCLWSLGLEMPEKILLSRALRKDFSTLK